MIADGQACGAITSGTQTLGAQSQTITAQLTVAASGTTLTVQHLFLDHAHHHGTTAATQTTKGPVNVGSAGYRWVGERLG